MMSPLDNKGVIDFRTSSIGFAPETCKFERYGLIPQRVSRRHWRQRANCLAGGADPCRPERTIVRTGAKESGG